MKAQVYGFYDERMRRFRWQISLAIEVDIKFWLEACNQGDEKSFVDTLYVIPEYFSMGQALALRDGLNDQLLLTQIQIQRQLKQCQKELNLATSIVNIIPLRRKNSVQLNPLMAIGTKQQQLGDSLVFAYLEEIFLPALEGRQLLWDELVKAMDSLLEKEEFQTDMNSQSDLLNLIQLRFLQGDIHITSGVSYPIIPPKLQSNFLEKIFSLPKKTPKHNLICNRCQSSDQVYIRDCQTCQEACATCENCIAMGRSKTCAPLVYFPVREDKAFVHPQAPCSKLTINLQLSPYQQKISEQAVDFFNHSQKKELLIWAVTGAGKTEMIFPVVQEALNKKKKILLASPRKDVIRELTPRFQNAFPQIAIASLYGGSKESMKSASLYLATTHQVIRFVAAFDLIIIDEMDAFPYHNNDQLQAYVQRAIRDQGKIIYLSATPDAKWLDKVKRKYTELAILPIRYHQQPLPVPKLIIAPKKNNELIGIRAMEEIKQFILHVKEQKGQAFIFVPTVKQIQQWLQQWKQWFPNLSIEAVHASDKRRDQKVDAFKRNQIQFLITTTIMERGITIPNLHVLVLDADSRLFDSATLIQIAGRVGRSKAHSDGLVWFIAKQKTEAMNKARKQIMKLNLQAEGLKRKGQV